MCGIFGLFPKGEFTHDGSLVEAVLNELFKLSESRGQEAAGVIKVTSQRITVLKEATRGSLFVRSRQYIDLLRDRSEKLLGFVGHTRLATNGSFLETQNNQPVYFGSCVGVHNGIVVNDKELWRSFLSRKAPNELDSTIIMALLDSFLKKNTYEDAARQLFRSLEGEASIAVLSTLSPYLLLASNTGSLYTYQDSKLFLFASERLILQVLLRRCLNSKDEDLERVQQLPANDGLLVDVHKGVTSPFSLRRATKRGGHTPQLKPIFKIDEINRSVSTQSSSLGIVKSINAIRDLKKYDFEYSSLYALKRCLACILPITTPFIEFDDKGICNYCRLHKPFIYKGRRSLEELVAPYRSTNGEADCLVGFSGGRDSSYGLHYLKTKLKLNPIAFTYDWGMLTDLGRQNAARMVGKLGVEHIVVSADIERKRANIRKNILSWLKKPDLGMVPLFMAGDKQAELEMDRLQKQLNIQLVIYCRGNEYEKEEFKSGHAGVKEADPGGVIHDLALRGKLSLGTYYLRQFMHNPAYLNSSLIDTMKAYWITYFKPHDFVYLWHYLPWDEQELITVLTKEYNWQRPQDTIATWRIDDASPPFYNYIYYSMQGFTENDSLRSHQIREGKISRKEAWALVCEENRPRYEALQWYFDSLQLDGVRVLKKVSDIGRLRL